MAESTMDKVDVILLRARYTHKEKALHEVKMVLRKYKDLRPLVDKYVFDDGSQRELLCLDGTVPVNYRSTTYNIPLQFWLPVDFPHARPLVFVRPTQQMLINPSPAVDASGIVKLPYLNEWSVNQSDLCSLIQILQLMFEEKPPVFAKVTDTAAAAALPLARLSSAHSPRSASARGTHPTLLQLGAMPIASDYWQPFWNDSAGAGPASGQYPPLANAAYPPLPPIGSQVQPSNTFYPMPQNAIPESIMAAMQPSVVYGASQMTMPVPTMPVPNAYVTEEHLRTSLISAVREKLNRKLFERLSQRIFEVQGLRVSQAEIEQGSTQLDGYLNELQRETDQGTAHLTQIRTYNMQVDETIERLKANELPIDDVLVPSAPVYKQLVELYAEELALDDAIYFISDALHRETIDLDVYAKNVRELARKQFYTKLIAQKCREKAGLAP